MKVTWFFLLYKDRTRAFLCLVVYYLSYQRKGGGRGIHNGFKTQFILSCERYLLVVRGRFFLFMFLWYKDKAGVFFKLRIVYIV